MTSSEEEGPTAAVPPRVTRVHTAYERLRTLILENRLAPGAMMLEEAMARDFQMSRTPIREALIRLAEEELVDILPRRGFRVRAVTQRDVKEIDEVLAALEVLAVERLASKPATVDEVAALEDTIAGMDAALESEDMAAWAHADFRFHTLLIELCGNSHLVRTGKAYLAKAHRARLLTLHLRKRPVYSNSNHAAVVGAIKRADPETARDIHLAHKRRWSLELAAIAARGDLDNVLTKDEQE